MRLFLVSLLFLTACASSSEPREDAVSFSSDPYSGPPPTPIVCDEKLLLCGVVCVDISRDNQNCGGCGEVCDVGAGEFCVQHYCRNVRDYGFTFAPVGPRAYDVRRDLPRPSPMQIFVSP